MYLTIWGRRIALKAVGLFISHYVHKIRKYR